MTADAIHRGQAGTVWASIVLKTEYLLDGLGLGGCSSTMMHCMNEVVLSSDALDTQGCTDDNSALMHCVNKDAWDQLSSDALYTYTQGCTEGNSTVMHCINKAALKAAQRQCTVHMRLH
jgi:hypothetical protein